MASHLAACPHCAARLAGFNALSAEFDRLPRESLGCDLAVAEQMAGKAKQGKRMNRAVRVIGALDNYGKFFDDPSFQTIAH